MALRPIDSPYSQEVGHLTFKCVSFRAVYEPVRDIKVHNRYGRSNLLRETAYVLRIKKSTK